jgi:predicted esterase
VVAARAALIAALAVAAPAAQVGRYDLAQRLKPFEAAFAAADREGRARCRPHLEAAVRAFFGLDFAGGARALDAATFAARSAQPPDPGESFAAASGLQLDRRLCDAAALAVGFALRADYDCAAKPPENALLRLRIGDRARDFAIGTLPLAGELGLAGLGPGDHLLTVEIIAGERALLARTQLLSLASDLDVRLERLRAAADALEPTTTERATLRALARQCAALTRRRSPETDVPGAALLAEAEALLDTIPANAQVYDHRRAGDWRLHVVAGTDIVPLRLLVPPGLAAQAPRPLLIALHGAGGSENMFFEGYGNGAIVEAARTRGWLLVAPRNGGGDLGALIDALAARYPIDRARVSVIGHSMGGAQAVAAVARAPEQFAAAAVLGGGGTVRRADLSRVRFFVGAGEHDFGRRGAERLRDDLRDRAATVRWELYPEVEHLAVVQAALADVFTWLDETLASGADDSGQRRRERE